MAFDATLNSKKTDQHSTSDIRQLKRLQRQSLTPSEQQQHSQSLCQLIIREQSYKNSQHIAVYIANDGEIDPALLIEHATFLDKTIYLPILSPLKNSLYFAPYAAGDRLKLNRFGIPEPVCQPTKWKKASQLNLLLLPLVAFDTQGNRVGMGGGFYDRTLAYLKHRRYWKKPTLVGLAHEIQKIEQINAQSWDIPLNAIATENQLYNIPPNQSLLPLGEGKNRYQL